MSNDMIFNGFPKKRSTAARCGAGWNAASVRSKARRFLQRRRRRARQTLRNDNAQHYFIVSAVAKMHQIDSGETTATRGITGTRHEIIFHPFEVIFTGNLESCKQRPVIGCPTRAASALSNLKALNFY
ncbi:hypothetical protein [Ensifer aridi]|uniref:hypothetical protein n=1 Tax=Ensifer aridi TaxID=1708715 RepID=UPI00111C81E1|nr:hypothetical protein [Ensifer aridi]